LRRKNGEEAGRHREKAKVHRIRVKSTKMQKNMSKKGWVIEEGKNHKETVLMLGL